MKNLILTLNILIISTLILGGNPSYPTSRQDTSILNQLYYNGRVWYGQYFNVYGTEFLIEDAWYKADITINGIPFNDVKIKYDIYNDELLANYYDKRIIILNNENIEKFTIYINDHELHFKNFHERGNMAGYYQLIYEGQSKLYKKWRKKRAQFVIEARYDEFQDDDAIIIVLEDRPYEIRKRRNLLKILSDKKSEIRSFIRQEDIRLDFDKPESLIPVLKYYDNL
ncbi:MAG: hypothetical protein U9N72_08200 [Bacteroidota bacterium]|nr:hypothetical protein [Bacteroidota bacterium]